MCRACTSEEGRGKRRREQCPGALHTRMVEAELVDGTGNVVVNDDRIIINTTKTATGIGNAGDRAGSISYDGTNLYVCTANYDGSTAVWKKLVLQAI